MFLNQRSSLHSMYSTPEILDSVELRKSRIKYESAYLWRQGVGTWKWGVGGQGPHFFYSHPIFVTWPGHPPLLFSLWLPSLM